MFGGNVALNMCNIHVLSFLKDSLILLILGPDTPGDLRGCTDKYHLIVTTCIRGVLNYIVHEYGGVKLYVYGVAKLHCTCI